MGAGRSRTDDGVTTMIEIRPGLEISESEISYVFSPSSKPGGQNVNKVSTRVTLLFQVDASPNLSEEQRELIRNSLASRIGKDGCLRVASQKHRTQGANREAALERLVALLAEATRPRRRRRSTRVPAEAKENRLRTKKIRGRLKRERSRPLPES
jgi:ribosome-associated protein